MKKLLVAAAFAAMSMGAQAYVGVQAYWENAAGDTLMESYETAYLLRQADFNKWSANDGTLDGLLKVQDLLTIVRSTSAERYESGGQIYSRVLYEDTNKSVRGTASDFVAVIASETDYRSINFGDNPGVYYNIQKSEWFAANSTGTPFAVPEPTSGMLFLLGLAGLALKRKRA